MNWWFELFERKGLVLFFLICLIISVYAKPLKLDEIDWFSESIGDLKISTDAKTYYGVSSAEVLVKVENLQGVDELTDLAVLFEDKWAGDPGVEVESVSVLQENVPYQVPVTSCSDISCSYAFDENTDLNGFVSRFYYCKNTKTPCEFDEKTDTCTYRECVTTQETRYRDEWHSISLTEPKNLSSKVNYREWNGKKFHAKKGTKFFKQLKAFKKNETVFLKIKIKFPPGSKGEFAIATEDAFLDPWWNSNWLSKYAINSWNVTTDMNTTNMIKVAGVDFSALNSQCASAEDIRIVNEETLTEVSDVNFEGWNGTNTDTDVNILFRPTASISSGTYNGKYYIYSNNSACPSPTNYTRWQTSFDGFENNDYSSAPVWTVESGTASISTTIYKEGSHSLKLLDAGVLTSLYTLRPNAISVYNVWMRTEDITGAPSALIKITDSAGTMIAQLAIRSSAFAYKTDSVGWTNFSATPSNSTWYLMQIVYPDNATTVDFFVYDASGSLIEGHTGISVTAATVGRVYLQDDLKESYFDNVSFDKAYNFSYSLGSEETQNTISVEVLSPNGGETWSGTHTIDFNVQDTDNKELHAHISYSTVQGAFQNDLNVDLNLNNASNISFLSCSDVNWTTMQTCSFEWQTWHALDGDYYVDVNVFQYNGTSNKTDSSDASFTLDNAPQFDANFVYSVNGVLDKENGVNTVTIDLNGQEWYKNVHPIAYQYDENNAVIGTSKNLTYVDGNEGDRLFKLTVTYEYDYNSDTFTDTNTNLIRIPEYPQGLDFNHSTASINSAVDFNAFVIRPGYIKSWYWDFNDGGNASGQNVQHTFTATGDFNVCVEVQNIFDLNRKKCNIVPVGGRVIFNFWDENDLQPLQPSVVFDGNNYTPDANGVLVIPLVGMATKRYEMVAWDGNAYPERHFLFDLNQYSDENYVINLLSTKSGLNISFKFYDTDESTVLSNAFVRVHKKITVPRWVGMAVTNDDGEATFFLNQSEPNYYFEITKSNGETLQFRRALVTVQVPKDEITLASVTPFDIVVSVLKNTVLQDKTTPQEVYVFSNTVSYYQFLIDADGYLSRKYHVQLKGDENSLVLTPYLVDDSNGASMTLKTVNYVTNKRIPGVEVKIYRNFENAGKVLVEQVVTDAKGEALVSGLPNYSYEYEVYYNGKLVDVQDITVTSTTIVISFNPAQTTAVLPIGTASVNFYPQGGLLDESTWIITQTISIDANAPSVDRVLIYATETDANKQTSDVNLYVKTINSVGVGTTVFNSIDLNGDLTPAWDNNNNLVITVVIVYSDGSSYAWQQVYVKKIGTQALNVWSILTSNMFAIVGCDEGKPCGILILIAVFFTIFIIAALVTTTPLRNPAHVTLVSIIPIIFFTVLGWLPIFWSVMYSVFVIVGLFAFGRVRT